MSAGPGVLPSAPPAWTGRYVGLPFAAKGRDRAGVDCWGLVRLVLAERAGLELPAYVAGYAGTAPADAADIARLIAGGKADYVAVDPAAARSLDIALFRVLGHDWHVGVIVARGWMLHVQAGIDAALERHDGAAWARRLAGVYRHRGLA